MIHKYNGEVYEEFVVMFNDKRGLRITTCHCSKSKEYCEACCPSKKNCERFNPKLGTVKVQFT